MEPARTPIGFRKQRLEKKSLNKPFKSPLVGLIRKQLEKRGEELEVTEEIRLYRLGLKQLDDKDRILELIAKWRTVSKSALDVLRKLISVENGTCVTLAEMALMVKVQINEIGEYDPDQDEFVEEQHSINQCGEDDQLSDTAANLE